MSLPRSHYAWSIDGPTCFHPITNELHRKSALKHLCTRARGTGLFLSLYLLFLLSSFSPSDSDSGLHLVFTILQVFINYLLDKWKKFFHYWYKKIKKRVIFNIFFLSLYNTILFFCFQNLQISNILRIFWNKNYISKYLNSIIGIKK